MAELQTNTCEFFLYDDENYTAEEREASKLRFVLTFNDDLDKEDGEEYFELMATLNGVCWLMFNEYGSTPDVSKLALKAVSENKAEVMFINRKNDISIKFTKAGIPCSVVLNNSDYDTRTKLSEYAKESRLSRAEESARSVAAENQCLKERVAELELENKRLIELLAAKPLI
jgi:hypothetical protein